MCHMTHAVAAMRRHHLSDLSPLLDAGGISGIIRHRCSSLPVTSCTFLPSFLAPPFRFFGCEIMSLCSLYI
jgi:hypothetical protein